MFGMGGSEILVILVIALLFLGPEKLPQAAKQISKGIRDIKKQSRSLQQQIENDDQIGGAIRDIKSALRGDDVPARPKPIKKPRTPKALAAAATATTTATALPEGDPAATAEPIEPATEASAGAGAAHSRPPAEADAPSGPARDASGDHGAPRVTLPPVAGEADTDVADGTQDAEDLGKLIRPAEGIVAKGSEPKHG